MVEARLHRAFIQRVKWFAHIAYKRRAVQLRKRYLSMARVSIKKAGAKPPANDAPSPSVDEDIDLSDIDLELDESVPADLVSDIDLDDLGAVETDDLGVSVEDVEAAMASIAPVVSQAPVVAGAVPAGIADAALAALAADVAKLHKSIAASDEASRVGNDSVLTAVASLKESMTLFADSLTAAMERHAAFVTESHKTLVHLLSSQSPVQQTAPVTTAGQLGKTGEDWSRLDQFLEAQFAGLGAGKVYPCDKVADVFAKRIQGFSPSQIQARIAVVYADAIKAAGKPGYFSK